MGKELNTFLSESEILECLIPWISRLDMSMLELLALGTPSEYKVFPKTKTLFRGIYIKKDEIARLKTVNDQIYLPRRPYQSFTSSLSIAKYFASGFIESCPKKPWLYCGLVFKKTFSAMEIPVGSEIVISIGKFLRRNRAKLKISKEVDFFDENEYLIRTTRPLTLKKDEIMYINDKIDKF